jgi:threonine dehydratase
MPETVPHDRVETIEGLGSSVELVPSVRLMEAVNVHTANGRVLIHPFDDESLIAGHGSAGLEILEDIAAASVGGDGPSTLPLGKGDVVAVCCGGGGLVSGVAAALKLSGCEARVVAVEPEGCPCMHRSFELGRAARAPADFGISTIAHGLAPPFAGEKTFEHCKAFVDDVVLVTDEELAAATRAMFEHGLVAETSGCAGVAAAMAGKVNGRRIVCIVSGSNISAGDLKSVVDGTWQEHRE